MYNLTKRAEPGGELRELGKGDLTPRSPRTRAWERRLPACILFKPAGQRPALPGAEGAGERLKVVGERRRAGSDEFPIPRKTSATSLPL